jgi:hypothetical protein
MKCFRFILSLLLRACPCMLANSALFAALPQWVYDDLKSKAPEVLTIKVTSVEVIDSVVVRPDGRGGCWKYPIKQVCAKAEVTAVDRSATGLKPGSIIQIIYATAPTPEHVGTAVRPEILDKGMMRRAYLKIKGAGVTPDNAARDDDESYDVAAWGQSFEKVD